MSLSKMTIPLTGSTNIIRHGSGQASWLRWVCSQYETRPILCVTWPNTHDGACMQTERRGCAYNPPLAKSQLYYDGYLYIRWGNCLYTASSKWFAHLCEGRSFVWSGKNITWSKRCFKLSEEIVLKVNIRWM